MAPRKLIRPLMNVMEDSSRSGSGDLAPAGYLYFLKCSAAYEMLSQPLRIGEKKASKSP